MSRKDSLFGNRPGFSSTPKTTDLSVDRDIETIQGLHKSIEANLRNALQNAIIIGEILSEKKRELPHGSFIPWIESNLPFSRMTANKYVRLFESKHLLPNVNSGLHLTEALKLLSDKSQDEKEINPIAKPTKNPAELYKEYKSGSNLTKDEKVAVRKYLAEKAESLIEKAESLRKESRQIK